MKTTSVCGAHFSRFGVVTGWWRLERGLLVRQAARSVPLVSFVIFVFALVVILVLACMRLWIIFCALPKVVAGLAQDSAAPNVHCIRWYMAEAWRTRMSSGGSRTAPQYLTRVLPRAAVCTWAVSRYAQDSHSDDNPSSRHKHFRHSQCNS